MTTATTAVPTHQTTGTLEEILTIALLTPMDDPSDENCIWGAPILLWGEPGIGKSDRVEEAGDSIDLPLETLYLSTLQPEDISGIPMGNAKEGVTRVCDLAEVQTLTAMGKGILFLDELSTVRPAVQGAGLGVVHKRRFAGKNLPGRVRVVAAANPPESAAGGWNLSLPMANRLLHLEVKAPSASEWAAWLLGQNNHEEITAMEGEEKVKANWGTAWPMLCGLGASFIKRNEAMLYSVPALGHPSRGKAWPSPRTWEIALRGMATAQALGRKELAIDLLDAAVGAGPCAEWAAWVAYADLPDPKDVLDRGWRVNRDRLDVGFAVISSAISYTLAKTDKDEKREYAIKSANLLAQLIKDGAPDLVLMPSKLLVRAGFNTKAGGDVERVMKPIIAYLGEKALATHA